MTKIRVENGPAVSSIEAAPKETILGALLRCGVDVPYCCRRGTCGMCASVLVAGEVERLAVRSDGPALLALPPGQVLICSARAMTDCHIKSVHALAPGGLGRRVSVEACRVLADSAVHLRVATTDPALPFSFRAGQQTKVEFPPYAGVSAPHLFIASRPGMLHIDFYLPLDDRGRRLVENLRPADVLVLHEPIGSSSIGEDESEPVIIIAEGAGLASALGMVEMLTGSARAAFVFMVGAPDGVVERLTLAKAARCGTPAVLLDTERDLRAAISESMAGQGTPWRTRACVKGTAGTVKFARTALLELGVRPWDIHVDNLE